MLGTICIYFLLISANVYLQALELIWMMYCPEATGLKKYRDSLWMTPQIEGAESMKLTSKFLYLSVLKQTFAYYSKSLDFCCVKLWALLVVL